MDASQYVFGRPQRAADMHAAGATWKEVADELQYANAATARSAAWMVQHRAVPVKQRKRRLVAPTPTPIDDLPPSFYHWLTGFVDGEGSFHASPTRTHIGFSVALRADDGHLLESLANDLGIGRIAYHGPANGRSTLPSNRKPRVHWYVGNLVECQHLVTIFDAYPLRSKKARDFNVWRQLVALMPIGHQQLRKDEYHRLVKELRAGREYRETDKWPSRPSTNA